MIERVVYADNDVHGAVPQLVRLEKRAEFDLTRSLLSWRRSGAICCASGHDVPRPCPNVPRLIASTSGSRDGNSNGIGTSHRGLAQREPTRQAQ